jgi:hypothetical protein
MLIGAIETGDARAIESLLQANRPFLGRLELNSNGGSVNEAMQIGRVARRYYLETEAPSTIPEHGERRYWFNAEVKDATDALCASACFFAWLGGVNRTGDILAIHRPFPPAVEMKKLSPAEADKLFDYRSP